MKVVKFIGSLAIIIALTVIANKLSKLNAVVEFPIYAAVLGIIAGNIPRVSMYIKSATKAEFFIKVGLVLLGASVSFGVIMSIGWRGMVQALIGVTLIFFLAWFVSGWFGLDKKFRAVLASAVSICGVSAAIAGAGAVKAEKEKLTYVIMMVIAFALPLMVVIPILANIFGLSPAVAGAWAGNNIDTTAAVVGAGQIMGEQAVKVASVVKMSQNVLIGVVAFSLALYFALRVDRKAQKPSAVEIWHRFPKFVIGFVLLSILASLGIFDKAQVKTIGALQKWFFATAFVCIGMGFNFKELRKLGGKPLLVFAIVTVINTVTALGLSYWLFGDYEF